MAQQRHHEIPFLRIYACAASQFHASEGVRWCRLHRHAEFQNWAQKRVFMLHAQKRAACQTEGPRLLKSVDLLPLSCLALKQQAKRPVILLWVRATKIH